MTDQTSPVTIDIDKINAEIESMPQDKVKEALLGMRVRQKVQQKKQQGKGSQKVYQARKRAQFNALKAKAIALGIWDDVNDAAEKEADAKLLAETEVDGDEVGDQPTQS